MTVECNNVQVLQLSQDNKVEMQGIRSPTNAQKATIMKGSQRSKEKKLALIQDVLIIEHIYPIKILSLFLTCQVIFGQFWVLNVRLID